MPVFEFTTKDGRRFQLEAADAQSAEKKWIEQGRSAVYGSSGSEYKSGAVEDYGKAIGSGLVEGMESLAGFAGDVVDLTRGVGTWIGNKARVAAGKEPLRGLAPDPLGLSTIVPDTQAVADFQRGVTGFQPYEPERTGARYAKAAATYAPAAAGLGAVGGAKGAMYAAGKYGVVPGLTSEAGGDVARLAYGEDARPIGQVVGALAGPSIAGGIKRAVTPFPAGASQKRAVETLGKEGVTSLSAGQRTGNRSLQMFESQQAPAKMAQMGDDVGAQFTSAALRKAGIQGSDILPETIVAGFDELGSQFNRFSSAYRIKWDNSLTASMKRAVSNYRLRVSAPNEVPLVSKYVEEAVNRAAKNNGVLPGEAYQSMRSRISADARSASNPDLARALRELLSSLDDAMERAIAQQNPRDVGKWKVLRQQYKNMLVLDKAAGSAAASAGILSPAQLRIASRSVEGYKGRSRGYSDFDKLIRAGEIAMKRMPDSGTASRLATYGIPTMGGMAGAIGGYQATDNPWGGLIGGLVGAGARNMATSGLMSKQGMAYLGNQLLSNTVAPNVAPLSTAINASLPMRRPLEVTVPIPSK